MERQAAGFGSDATGRGLSPRLRGNLSKTSELTIAEQYAAVGVYLEETDDARVNGAGFRGDPLDPLSLRAATLFRLL